MFESQVLGCGSLVLGLRSQLTGVTENNYNVMYVLQSVTRNYYKMWQLLQSDTKQSASSLQMVVRTTWLAQKDYLVTKYYQSCWKHHLLLLSDHPCLAERNDFAMFHDFQREEKSNHFEILEEPDTDGNEFDICDG